MNKVFRVIWNAAMQRFVVASELAKGKVKSQSAGIAAEQPAQKILALSAVAAALMLTLNPLSVFAAETVIADNVAKVVEGEDIVATGNRATVGQKSMGLSAANGGSIDFSNGTITTSGTGGVGIMANNSSSATIRNTEIKTTGSTAPALMTQNGSVINADGLKITSSGASSYGMQAIDGFATISNSSITASAYGVVSQGANGNITVNNTTINTSGENGHAVYALKAGQITVNDSTLAATGHFGRGAYATGAGSTININNSNISTAGSSSEAVYAQNGGTINLTNTNIFTDRINSYGLRANGVNAVVNYDGGTVTTTGATRTVQALNSGKLNISNATINSVFIGAEAYSKGTINLDKVTININGTVDPTAASAGIFAYNAGTVLNAKNTQINTVGENAPGIQINYNASATLDNVEINSAIRGDGLQAYSGSTITANNVRMNIDSQDGLKISSGLSMGMYAGDNKVDLNNSKITMNGANTAGLVFKSNAVSNNTLSLNNSTVSATAGTAMLVTNTADTVVNASGTMLTGATLLSVGAGNNAGVMSNVELSGGNGSVFNGDVIVDRANTAKNIINLTNNSAWTGATDSLENLNVSSGSAWNVTRSSAVDNLTLDNGTLDMTAPGSGYSEVTIGNLTSNNGTIDFKTHLEGDDSVTDDLVITGNYSGNSNVVVKNAGGTGAQTLNGIELIRVDGDINGTFAQQGRIVAGAYDYHLVQDGNKWLLRDDMVGAIGGESGAPVIGDGITPVKSAPITRPETGSYAANLAAANTLFTTSLDDRLGETHYIGADGNKHSTSLWLRNAGGHTRFSDSSGQLKTTGNRYVMQLGGDIVQWSSNGDDRFHLGVMGGYANAQSNTISSVTGYSAKGEVHGYSTGVYATWLQDNAEQTGAYVDSWMLYNWFDNSIKGQDIATESYKSKGITASLEAGYSVKMTELNERSSFYLQPKAQATWMGVQADDHQERNGTRVVGEGNNNVQTRLGVRAYVKGHNPIDDGKNRTFEPFIEANWIHNTETFGSSLNGVTVKQAGARDLGELKVGVDAKLNNSVNLWGNIGQQIGDKGYSDSSAMVGVKVNF